MAKKQMEFSVWIRTNRGMTDLLWDMSTVHFKTQLLRYFMERRDQFKTLALKEAWSFLTIANGQQKKDALQLARELARIYGELEQVIAHIELQPSAPQLTIAETASSMLSSREGEKKPV